MQQNENNQTSDVPTMTVRQSLSPSMAQKGQGLPKPQLAQGPTSDLQLQCGDPDPKAKASGPAWRTLKLKGLSPHDHLVANIIMYANIVLNYLISVPIK